MINLFAIGLFGWVIVPLNLLAGLCYLLLPAVADQIWALVSAIVAGLHELIAWLTTLPALSDAWLYTSVNSGILLMVLLIMLLWLLPRGLISRWLVLPPLTLLMMTVYANQQILLLTPTLYVLPTGDPYLSAAVLQYPMDNSETDNGNDNSNKHKKSPTTQSVSWLFLADHRAQETRSMPSSMTADKLSATLAQQLRTLSIKNLEGIVVQTSTVALTDTLAINNGRDNTKASAPELLPMTVVQLSQRLPTSQYWQAGHRDRWSICQQNYTEVSQSKNLSHISAQRCEQGKTLQLANGNLTLQVLTGWPKIEDASVWDCTVAISSGLPINIIQYNAVDPQRSPRLASQVLSQTAIPRINNVAIDATTKDNEQKSRQQKSNQSTATQTRIILDAATHQRVWNLWSLLCAAEPLAIDMTLDNSTTWLGHSASRVSTEMLTRQGVSEVMTYNDEPLAVALALGSEPQTD